MDHDRRRGDRRLAAGRRQVDESKKSFSSLVILTVLSSLALVFFLAYQSGIGNDVDWRKFFNLKVKTGSSFEMGGVEFGMDPEMVEKKHPNLDLTSLVRGEKIATFKTGGARYTVWFVSINGRDKAYRIRYDQVFKGKTETDIVEDIGRRHGKPGTSDCSAGAAGERRCHFQWWPSGGISLNVLSITRKRAGQPVTGVTMIATDTYLDGKRIRNQDRQ
ncbi:MAG TPA: hypothetical protein ENI69_02070 [Rhodospirillales bacterium]|nr:hypothetical protein [Rhodospirillales bacterium]